MLRNFTAFELAASGGILALVADLGWLTKDIIHNGFHLAYVGVGVGLLFGITITAIGWYRHYHQVIKYRAKHHHNYYHKYDEDWN